jgi:hypothetical protein
VGVDSSIADASHESATGSDATVTDTNSNDGSATCNDAACLYEQTKELTANDGASDDYFGSSVAIYGNNAIVGAPDKSFGSSSWQGAAYVFSFDGSTWAQQAELTENSGSPGTLLGWSVAISGNTAIVGAEYKAVGSNTDQGAAYVFSLSASTWAQQGELLGQRGGLVGEFGGSVAISDSAAIVGASYTNVGSNTKQGTAYIFTN